MNKLFQDFLSNITLTSSQSSDAQTKYTGVCQKLYSNYYGNQKYDEKKKYLFGSYKTKTNVRPLSEDQDVDVLFKIPKDTFDKFDAYKSNGQEALLQEVKDVLKEKYTTTDTIKAWGKVVLVKFSQNHHNVELLPALEQDDGTFLIPNSEGGGSWETFDPRSQVEKFSDSNTATSGLTRKVVKCVKTWVRHTASLKYSSHNIMTDVIAFLADCYPEGLDDGDLGDVLSGYFTYFKSRLDKSDSRYSYFSTAKSRADSAIEYANKGKRIEASEEWRKIFGDVFPLADNNDSEDARGVNNFLIAPRPWGIN